MLTATAANRSHDYPGDDVLTVQFRFRSGVTGSLANLATTPFYSRITVFGDRGWVEAREYSNVDVLEDATREWHVNDGEAHNRTFPPHKHRQGQHRAMGGGGTRNRSIQVLR